MVFFSLLTLERRRWKRVSVAWLSGGFEAAPGCGVTAPGRGGGGAPRREVRCHSRSDAASSGPERGGRAGIGGSPAFPGKGCSEARRGGELAVCRGALRSCRRGFPRYSGVPPRLSQKPDRERSSTCDCAGVSSGVSADWKPLCAMGGDPRGARLPPTSGWRSGTPQPRPGSQNPRGSAAPPGQPPGTSTFLAPGQGRWVEGVPCFE